MKITFNPRMKVTKRHMEVLAQYVPVKEYGYPTVYWAANEEHKTRKAACEAMLKQLHLFADSGIIPAIENTDILSELSSQSSGNRQLFIEVE